MTETCQMCGLRIDATAPHVTVVRQVEQRHGDTVTVLDAEVMAYLHLGCGAPWHSLADDQAGVWS